MNWFRKKPSTTRPEIHFGDRNRLEVPRGAVGPRKILGFVEMVLASRDDEISCDECGNRLAEFAELTLAGTSAVETIPLVEDHLKRCSECLRFGRVRLHRFGQGTNPRAVGSAQPRRMGGIRRRGQQPGLSLSATRPSQLVNPRDGYGVYSIVSAAEPERGSTDTLSCPQGKVAGRARFR